MEWISSHAWHTQYCELISACLAAGSRDWDFIVDGLNVTVFAVWVFFESSVFVVCQGNVHTCILCMLELVKCLLLAIYVFVAHAFVKMLRQSCFVVSNLCWFPCALL